MSGVLNIKEQDFFKLPYSSETEKIQLTELCDSVSDEADGYFSEKIKNEYETYLPALCFARCKAASDLAAEKLDYMMTKLLDGELVTDSELAEVLFLLCFKQSDRLTAALDRLGQSYEKLKNLRIDYFTASSQCGGFVRDRCIKAADDECETRFYLAVNDILICTMLRGGSIGDTVKKLYDKYPKAFPSAGFFAYFTEDTVTAYDRFAVSSDDEMKAHMLGVFGGFDYKSEIKMFVQYGPLWYGLSNDRWHGHMVIAAPDKRWNEFLTGSITEETLKIRYCNDESGRHGRFSRDALSWVNTDDPESVRIFGDFFKRQSMSYTSIFDVRGLEMCRSFKGHEEEIALGVAKAICDGTNSYLSLYHIFSCFNVSRIKKNSLLKKVSRYIIENETDPDRVLGRNAFQRAVFDQINCKGNPFGK